MIMGSTNLVTTLPIVPHSAPPSTLSACRASCGAAAGHLPGAEYADAVLRRFALQFQCPTDESASDVGRAKRAYSSVQSDCPMLPLGVLGHLIAHRPIATGRAGRFASRPWPILGPALIWEVYAWPTNLCALRAQSLQVAELTLGSAARGHRATWLQKLERAEGASKEETICGVQ